MDRVTRAAAVPPGRERLPTSPVPVHRRVQDVPPERRGWFRWVVFGVALAYFLTPVVATVLYSLATAWRNEVLPDGYTVHWWRLTLSNPRVLEAIGRSVALAFSTVVFVNLLVLPVIYWSHVRNRRIFPILAVCAMIPFTLPGIVMAHGVARFVGISPHTAPLQATPTLLFLAHVAATFSFYLWATNGAMAAAHVAKLHEAAQACGASELCTLWRVILPNVRTGILTGSVLIFASSMNDLSMARIITGNAFETLPLWKLSQLREAAGNPNGLAVMSVLNFAMLFAVSAVMVLLSSGEQGSRGVR